MPTNIATANATTANATATNATATHATSANTADASATKISIPRQPPHCFPTAASPIPSLNGPGGTTVVHPLLEDVADEAAQGRRPRGRTGVRRPPGGVRPVKGRSVRGMI